MADAAVALALLQMATPQRTVARVQRNSHDSDVSSKTPSTSPERCFKVTHVKRTRDDLVTVVYSTGDESMEIPFARGESPSVFYHRREKAARILFDANRKDVYCTWRKALVSIVVQSSSWLLFKDSPQQKRYAYGSIQLVVTRYTCCQWKDHDSLCRTCQNRAWRLGCQTPTYCTFIT